MVAKKIPTNLVVISGMHGSGKDTLIEDLLCVVEKDTIIKEYMPYDIKRYTKCDMTSFDNLFERQIRRITKHAIDWYRAIKMAVENPDSIIITDRGFLDANAYLRTFYLLNMLNTAEFKLLEHLLELLFSTHDMTKIDPFVLCPPFDFIEKNLAKRKEEGKAKWNEDDMEYNKMVYRNYVFSSKDRSVFKEPPDEFPYSLLYYKELKYTYIKRIVSGFCTETDREKRVNILLKYCNERFAKFKKSEQYKLMKAGKYSEFHPSLKDMEADANEERV